MLLGKVFECFRNGSPVTAMLRGTMEYTLWSELLDPLFRQTTRRQYTPKLLFSTLVGLTSLVVRAPATRINLMGLPPAY